MGTRCTVCRKAAETPLSVSRLGAGAYNRAARTYRTTVCEPCARDIVKHADEVIADNRQPPTTVWRIEVRSARFALASLDKARAARAAREAEQAQADGEP